MKKLNLGDGGINAALTKHVEKIVFGICLVLVAVFIFLGLRLKGYDLQPTDMDQLAKQAKTNIEKDSWQNVQKQPERVTLTNYTEAVKFSDEDTPGQLYAYQKTLSPLDSRQMVKRDDPELFPPTELIVYSFNAPIALKDDGSVEDKLAALETVKVEKPRERKTERTRSNTGQRSRGGGIPGSFVPPGAGGGTGAIPFAPGGALGEGVGGDESGGPDTPKVLTNPEGWRPGGMMGATGGGMGGMMGGMAGAMGSGMAGAMGAPPSLQGGPGAGPRTTGEEGDETTTNPAAVKITFAPASFVVILCPVPNEKQVDEFKDKLADAIGYSPMRDTPTYLAFRVERAEVSDDPDAQLEWVAVGGTSSALQLKQKWADVVPEVAHPAYTDPALTMPIPPVLLRDLKDYVNHPKIPLASEQLPTSVLPATANPAQTEEGSDSELNGDIPSSNMLQNQPGIPGGTAGGMMSATPGQQGSPGSGRSSSAMMGGGMMSAMPGMTGGAPSSMMGAGSMMSGAMGGGSMMMGGAVATEYKLLRYFDFSAEPGKVYRYRVQLYLEDPNHPNTTDSRRPLRDPVANQMLTEAAAARTAKLKPEVYYRLTDWSAESAPISLPQAETFYAGTTVRGREIVHEESGAEVYPEPLEMEFAAVFWDQNLGVDVSAKTKDTIVGSVMDVKDDVEVVHPITLEFKLLKDYDLRAKAVIADVRGGEKVAVAENSDPLLQPIECAIVDAEGNLVVHNEIDDLELYRKYAFVEEEKQEGAAMPGMQGMPGGSGMGAGAMMGGAGAMPGGMGMMPGSAMGNQKGKAGNRNNRKKGR